MQAIVAGPLVLEHLRSVYGVTHVLATVEAENQRSIRLLDRLSFRPATSAQAAGHELTASERLYARRLSDGQNAPELEEKPGWPCT
jgi:RimJ/RimL family protein N-acetyltransferase